MAGTSPKWKEEFQLKPGLEWIARHIMAMCFKLGQGLRTVSSGGLKTRISRRTPMATRLALASQAAAGGARALRLHPAAALSPTQDDKSRLLWTLFRGSEQGRRTVFWKKFLLFAGAGTPFRRVYRFHRQTFIRGFTGADRFRFPASWTWDSGSYRRSSTYECPASHLGGCIPGG